MSLNLYGLIIKTANENNIDMTLEDIGKINQSINSLIARNISQLWIEQNIITLF